MSEMVEKVARALWADIYDAPWKLATPMEREDHMGHARAAIEAIGIPQDILERLAGGELTASDE